MRQFEIPVFICVNATDEDQAIQQLREFMLASTLEFRKIYDIQDFDINTHGVVEVDTE